MDKPRAAGTAVSGQNVGIQMRRSELPAILQADSSLQQYLPPLRSPSPNQVRRVDQSQSFRLRNMRDGSSGVSSFGRQDEGSESVEATPTADRHNGGYISDHGHINRDGVFAAGKAYYIPPPKEEELDSVDQDFFRNWDQAHVSRWLREHGWGEFERIFEERNLHGKAFFCVTLTLLQKIIPKPATYADRRKLLNDIRAIPIPKHLPAAGEHHSLENITARKNSYTLLLGPTQSPDRDINKNSLTFPNVSDLHHGNQKSPQQNNANSNSIMKPSLGIPPAVGDFEPQASQPTLYSPHPSTASMLMAAHRNGHSYTEQDIAEEYLKIAPFAPGNTFHETTQLDRSHDLPPSDSSLLPQMTLGTVTNTFPEGAESTYSIPHLISSPPSQPSTIQRFKPTHELPLPDPVSARRSLQPKSFQDGRYDAQQPTSNTSAAQPKARYMAKREAGPVAPLILPVTSNRQSVHSQKSPRSATAPLSSGAYSASSSGSGGLASWFPFSLRKGSQSSSQQVQKIIQVTLDGDALFNLNVAGKGSPKAIWQAILERLHLVGKEDPVPHRSQFRCFVMSGDDANDLIGDCSPKLNQSRELTQLLSIEEVSDEQLMQICSHAERIPTAQLLVRPASPARQMHQIPYYEQQWLNLSQPHTGIDNALQTLEDPSEPRWLSSYHASESADREGPLTSPSAPWLQSRSGNYSLHSSAPLPVLSEDDSDAGQTTTNPNYGASPLEKPWIPAPTGNRRVSRNSPSHMSPSSSIENLHSAYKALSVAQHNGQSQSVPTSPTTVSPLGRQWELRQQTFTPEPLQHPSEQLDRRRQDSCSNSILVRDFANSVFLGDTNQEFRYQQPLQPPPTPPHQHLDRYNVSSAQIQPSQQVLKDRHRSAPTAMDLGLPPKVTGTRPSSSTTHTISEPSTPMSPDMDMVHPADVIPVSMIPGLLNVPGNTMQRRRYGNHKRTTSDQTMFASSERREWAENTRPDVDTTAQQSIQMAAPGGTGRVQAPALGQCVIRGNSAPCIGDDTLQRGERRPMDNIQQENPSQPLEHNERSAPEDGLDVLWAVPPAIDASGLEQNDDEAVKQGSSDYSNHSKIAQQRWLDNSHGVTRKERRQLPPLDTSFSATKAGPLSAITEAAEAATSTPGSPTPFIPPLPASLVNLHEALRSPRSPRTPRTPRTPRSPLESNQPSFGFVAEKVQQADEPHEAGSDLLRVPSPEVDDGSHWGERPPTEIVYRDLDRYFKGHDLDRPIVDPVTNQSSTALNNALENASSPRRGALQPRKSIRHVANEARRRFSDAGTNRTGAIVRRKSTKFFDARVVEMKPDDQGRETSKSAEPLDKSDKGNRIQWIKGELIGKGSFGRVYHALNIVTGDMIAVKQVEIPQTKSDLLCARQADMVNALYQEITMLKDLDHENIVQYLGFEVTKEHINIFLEYVSGGSIASGVHKHGGFPEPVIRNFTRQILLGLEYLHERNILHRDIKAANILVDEDGVCKISDFGLSRKSGTYKLAKRRCLLKKMSIDGAYDDESKMSFQGSIFWMAPEVVKNQRCSAKIDIWSLGCLVLEMYTGQRPWLSLDNIGALYQLGQYKAPPLPQEISEMARDFLEKCFRIDPNERPIAADLLVHPFCRADNTFRFTDYVKQGKI
ncbi:hypothetical protein BZG36_02499 [Bifiguratus adelaidae]|uniref:Protein kinase domain-containing protein n=1 Tax=Bifiguratus adelaidae TaxID=1938954 RepID=A0A261Y2R4_9FUNG|nr:hypothetical protein BZG36_02499 [Bifiguratus adelaidae]